MHKWLFNLVSWCISVSVHYYSQPKMHWARFLHFQFKSNSTTANAKELSWFLSVASSNWFSLEFRNPKLWEPGLRLIVHHWANMTLAGFQIWSIYVLANRFNLEVVSITNLMTLTQDCGSRDLNLSLETSKDSVLKALFSVLVLEVQVSFLVLVLRHQSWSWSGPWTSMSCSLPGSWTIESWQKVCPHLDWSLYFGCGYFSIRLSA